MNRRLIGIALFFVLVMASVPLVMGLFGERGEAPSPNEPAQTLELQDERRIHISTRTVQPLMTTRLAFYYQPEPGAWEAPAFFASVPPDREAPRFVVHAAEGGDVVGVAAAGEPGALLILHDFETGESWPRHELVEGQPQLDARGERLLERLNARLPEMEFRLVSAEGLRLLEELIDLPASSENTTSPLSPPVEPGE